MDSFRRNQEQFRSAVEGAFATGPFAEIAKRNMAMFEAAATAFQPPVGGVPTPTPTPAAAAADAGKGDTLAALKAEMAALQAKVEKLGG